MNVELENKLCRAFPKIFKENFCFELDDGWYDLIYNLCIKLQKICDDNNCQLEALQVKEKFASLRFYFKTENASDKVQDELYSCVDNASKESSSTCEMTGGKGELYVKGYYYKTLCKESAILNGFTKPTKN
jgi:hypothetical protein